MNIELSRRRFLELSTAFGGIVAAGGLTPLYADDQRILTAEQMQGPFYPIAKPLDRDADLTQLRNRRGSAQRTEFTERDVGHRTHARLNG